MVERHNAIINYLPSFLSSFFYLFLSTFITGFGVPWHRDSLSSAELVPDSPWSKGKHNTFIKRNDCFLMYVPHYKQLWYYFTFFYNDMNIKQMLFITSTILMHIGFYISSKISRILYDLQVTDKQAYHINLHRWKYRENINADENAVITVQYEWDHEHIVDIMKLSLVLLKC